jgi:MoaA/NifB/PqqE/SkfB family radical SAM enzyme
MSKIIRPRKIRIEASTICQLKCPTCPTASKANQSFLGRGFLKFNDFQKILDDNPWISEVELSNYGEIFLNPELLDIIKIAYHRKVSLHADNGVNLNTADKEVLEGLVKYKFSSMTCSLDGACNETYRKYRIQGNFDTVIRNIKYINLCKQKYQSQYPYLSWQFVIFGHNEQELQTARLMANDLNMRFHVKLSWDSLFSPVKDLEAIRKEAGAASREEFKQKTDNNYKSSICHQLWDGPQINWDGKVLGCSRNFWGDFGGNVFADGLSESLNNENIGYARKMLLGKNKARSDIPCASCSLFLDMTADKMWLNRGFSYRIGQAVKSIPVFLKQYPFIYNALRTLLKSFRHRLY